MQGQPRRRSPRRFVLPLATERTPWGAMMAAALGFGVAPSAFWRLSLREWRVLIAPPPAEVLSRVAFDALLQRFPDVD